MLTAHTWEIDKCPNPECNYPFWHGLPIGTEELNVEAKSKFQQIHKYCPGSHLFDENGKRI